MARKETDVTISEEGRDKGKTYHLREMPASRAEKWAMKALFIAARSGLDIGDVAGGGMQAIAILGLGAIMKVNFEEAEPLLDEMMECISFKPDPQNPNVVRYLMEDDIEEVKTRLFLRKEVLNLHVDFSTAGAQSKSTLETPPTSGSNFSNIPMSPEASVQFSHQAKQP